jgi:regulatory protein
MTQPSNPEELARAKEICLRQLTVRPRTRLELRTAMLGKEVAEEVAEQVLDRFAEVGLIDDAAFAEVWVKSRHQYSGLAPRALAQELRRKGVADDLVKEAMTQVDEQSQEERARELVAKKLRAMSGVDHTAQTRRLVGMLARKGYGASLAYRVVREAVAAEEE